MNDRGHYGNAHAGRGSYGNARALVGAQGSYGSAVAGDPSYLPAYRNAAWVAVRRGLRHRRVPAIGYVRSGIQEKTYLFDSLDLAKTWHSHLPAGYDYAAVFDVTLDASRPLIDTVGSQYGGAHVGASILQTPGAIQDELSDINEDFLAFSKEITNEIERRGYPIKPGSENDPVVKIFTDAWTPLIQGWQAFYSGHKGWWGNFWWNSAPDAEAWHRKLIALREQVKARGMDVVSQKPETYSPSMLDPHHDIIDTAAETAKKGVGDVWKLAKYAVYGVLGIGAVVALSSVVQNLRSGTDPAEKYVSLLGRRRSREPLPFARALPRARSAPELEEGDG